MEKAATTSERIRKEMAELLKKKIYNDQDRASLFSIAFLLGLETARSSDATLKSQVQPA